MSSIPYPLTSDLNNQNKGDKIMKIRTLNDFKNLKEGTWLEDANGISEVVATYR